MEALAEAIIAAVPGERDEAGAGQTLKGGAARRDGVEDADHEHERLRVRHGRAATYASTRVGACPSAKLSVALCKPSPAGAARRAKHGMA